MLKKKAPVTLEMLFLNLDVKYLEVGHFVTEFLHFEKLSCCQFTLTFVAPSQHGCQVLETNLDINLKIYLSKQTWLWIELVNKCINV